MKRNIVKRLDDNHFIGGVIEIDPATWRITENSKIYITERCPTVIETFEDVSGESYIIPVRSVKANAFKSRVIKKFFAIVSNTFGKDYVREHNEVFKKIVGYVLVTIYKLLEAQGADKDWIIEIEIELVKSGDEVKLRRVSVSPTKPIKVYKLVE